MQSKLENCLHILRFTLEAESLISSGGEEGSGIHEAQIVRDANGLPTIAGSSIAGVLRHLGLDIYGNGSDETWVDELFGYQLKNEGEAARLWFSFGCVHNKENQAIQGLLDQDSINNDEVLKRLYLPIPVKRDHVSINYRGVADDKKKYDRIAVPIGTRFSFEITMWGDEDKETEDIKKLKQLCQLMKHSAFRIGNSTRRGYGKVKLTRLSHACLPVSQASKIAEIRTRSLDDCKDLSNWFDLIDETDQMISEKGTIQLAQHGLWRIGQGTHSFVEQEKDKEADALLLIDPFIRWEDDKAKLILPANPGEDDVYLTVPAATIKGALAHRMLFHYCCLTGNFIDGDSEDRELSQIIIDFFGSDTPLEGLVGSAKNDDIISGKQLGTAGRLIIDDAVCEIAKDQIVRLEHTSIDRFTGGVRNNVLFSEEVALHGNLKINFIMLQRPKDDPVDSQILKAFKLAIKDLCEQRLAIGAKGYGYCTGEVTYQKTYEVAA